MSPLEYFGVNRDDAERLWPSPVVSEDAISAQNATGVEDPRDRRLLEEAAFDVRASERLQRPLENPNSPKIIREILEKCGVELAA